MKEEDIRSRDRLPQWSNAAEWSTCDKSVCVCVWLPMLVATVLECACSDIILMLPDGVLHQFLIKAEQGKISLLQVSWQRNKTLKERLTRIYTHREKWATTHMSTFLIDSQAVHHQLTISCWAVQLSYKQWQWHNNTNNIALKFLQHVAGKGAFIRDKSKCDHRNSSGTMNSCDLLSVVPSVHYWLTPLDRPS